MSDEKKNQFARLLKYYLMLNNKQQIDVVNDLKYDKSTVSGWCNGSRVPKVDVIIQLADYLHVEPGDLIVQNNGQQKYYIDEETAETAQEMLENDKVLLEVYRSADKERLVAYAKKLEELRKLEEGEM